MSDSTEIELATTQAEQRAKNAWTPPPKTGTPEWVTKLKERRDGESWDVRIVRQAIDLLAYNDGAFWCTGHEGLGAQIDGDGNVANDSYSTNAAHSKFMPFREAWVDALPNGQYQLVTEKVCAIGSIQLLIGGGDDNADYATIIERLNEISHDTTGRSIVATNDEVNRTAVLEVMQEYVNRHGGKPGMVLPDFKPLVRFEKVNAQAQQQEHEEGDDDD